MTQTSSPIKKSSTTYQVELLVFQGPLDLLLSLIEQEELDITKISLAQVTNQYLAYLEAIKETNPDDLTDFLVIAAKLILIKSKILLPRPPASIVEEEEEDIGDELARQLLIYKQSFRRLLLFDLDQKDRTKKDEGHYFVRILTFQHLRLK